MSRDDGDRLETTEPEPRSAGSTDGIRVEGGGSGTLSIRRSNLDQEVSQPYAAWQGQRRR